jgi:hypothetical protein
MLLLSYALKQDITDLFDTLNDNSKIMVKGSKERGDFLLERLMKLSPGVRVCCGTCMDCVS